MSREKPFSLKSLLSLQEGKLRVLIQSPGEWSFNLKPLSKEERTLVFNKIGHLIIDSIHSPLDIACMIEDFSPFERPERLLQLFPAIERVITRDNHLIELLSHFPEDDRFTLFNCLDTTIKKEHFHSLLNSFDALHGLLTIMPKFNQKQSILLYFNSLIPSIITNYRDIAALLNVLPESAASDFLATWSPLIATLDSIDSFIQLLQHRSPHLQKQLLDTVGPSFFARIDSVNQLIGLLTVAPDYRQREILLQLLPLQNLIDLLKSGSALVKLLKCLSKDNQSTFISFIMPSITLIIHHDVGQLWDVMQLFSEREQSELLINLSSEMTHILPTGNQLSWLLIKLSDSNKNTLIDVLSRRLKTIITTGYELSYVLNELSEDQKDNLMFKLAGSIEILVSTPDILVRVLNEMSTRDKKLALLVTLAAQLKTMITTWHDFHKVIEALPDVLWGLFIYLSNAAALFDNGEQLINFLCIHFQAVKKKIDMIDLILKLLTGYNKVQQESLVQSVRTSGRSELDVEMFDILAELEKACVETAKTDDPEKMVFTESSIIAMHALFSHPTMNKDLDTSAFNAKRKAAPYEALTEIVFDNNYEQKRGLPCFNDRQIPSSPLSDRATHPFQSTLTMTNSKQSCIKTATSDHTKNAIFSESSNTFFSTPSANQSYPVIGNKKTLDTHWYTSDEINTLLVHYLGDKPNVMILTPMLGTDLNEQNALQTNLIQHNIRRMTAIAKGFDEVADKTFVPINLNQNHWVLLYIIYQRDATEAPSLYYFDPQGNLPPAILKTTLNQPSLFPHIDLIPLSERSVQSDLYNCGPWIIEVARNLVDGSGIKHDMNTARSQHMEVLAALNTTPFEKKTMSPNEVVTLMRSSASDEEWERNIKIVKDHFNGDYPPFWFKTIVISGVIDEVIDEIQRTRSISTANGL